MKAAGLKPYYHDEAAGITLYCGCALEILPTLPDASFALLPTDPPYFRVKDLPWDRQWKSDEEYLAWVGGLCDEWRRLLKPNGSLYVFASPQMAWGVEAEVRRRFNVLNRIAWRKEEGWAKRQCKEEMRAFWPASEAIIFAEQYGADGAAMGESGYEAKCDELRGFVFEPILRYITGEFAASGLSRRDVDTHFATANVSQYWLQPRGFIIPTAEKWAGLRTMRPNHFRREYEDLRREYEDLRRPFSVSENVPYTDVWDFDTVKHSPGKHPCEKPAALMQHIVQASSRPGDAVLDCFAGTGSTLLAARLLGRPCVGIEIDERYAEIAARRLEQGVLSFPDEEDPHV